MIDATSPSRSVRLHVGCGRSPLPGWVNLDVQLLPGVDVVADVTSGLCVRRASAVFAEHFLEHLPVDRALSFLEEAHRVLEESGWIRLSTPNLEWVLATHYREFAETDGDRGTLELNRAFYGWEHRFLWDRSFLARALDACGFDDVGWPSYGRSTLPAFRAVERHERSPDLPGMPHVLIVEARKGAPRPDRLAALRREVNERFLVHLEEAGGRRARLQLEHLVRVVARLHGETEGLHRELGRLRGELDHRDRLVEEARARSEAAERTVAWMQASRFWKARNAWFRLKRAVGPHRHT